MAGAQGASGPEGGPGGRPAGARPVDGYHAERALGPGTLDSRHETARDAQVANQGRAPEARGRESETVLLQPPPALRTLCIEQRDAPRAAAGTTATKENGLKTSRDLAGPEGFCSLTFPL